MRKSLILILALLIVVTAIGAQSVATNRRQTVHQLPAHDAYLDMRYSSELQRLYIMYDVQITKSEVDNSAVNGIFLPKDARIQYLLINGERKTFALAHGLTPTHFEPELPAQLLEDDHPAQFYVIPFQNFEQLPETFFIRINYIFDELPLLPYENNQRYLLLDSDIFWYPRSVFEPTKVQLKLTTTSYIKLMLGNEVAPHVDNSFERKHSITFVDDPAQPFSFKLIRE